MACKHRNAIPHVCPIVTDCAGCKVVAVCPDCGATLRPCDVAAAEAYTAGVPPGDAGAEPAPPEGT